MAVRVRIVNAGVVATQRAIDGVVDRKVVQPIARDMRIYVPVLTGDLRDTIRTEHVEPGLHRVWAGDEALGIDYSLYQEYGTSIMDAQPFIRPAVYQWRD